MKQEEQNYLGEEKLSKLLFKFSMPCILSLLIGALYNIVDQIFVGNSELGYLGNAATGIVFPLLIVAQAFAWCFGDGAAARLSICQGRKDMQGAHKCVGSVITASVIVSAAMMAIGFPLKENILRLFGASDATLGMATEYFDIVMAALPVYMLINVMNGIIRADGSPNFAMAAMASGAILNIILDPVFIYVCKWGIKGAAYATVLGEILSLVFCVYYYAFKTKTFKLKMKSFLIDWKEFSRATVLGISSFITQAAIVIISLVCNMMLAKYGALSKYGQDIPISVISVETKVFTVIINIVVGIVLGGQPIFGYNYGAKKYDRVRKLYRLVLKLTLIVGLAATAVVEIFPQAIVGIFGGGDELYREFAYLTFRIFLSLVSCTCFIKMTSIFLQSVGQPVKAALTSLTRELICFVPSAIILPVFFGVKGVLFAAPLADFLSVFVAVGLTICFFKKIPRGGD